MTKQRVAVILGGRSGEHEVSVRSGRSVLAALDPERWTAVPVGIARRGAWLDPMETQRLLDAGHASFGSDDGLQTNGRGALLSTGALAALESCAAAFPLVHGTYGEDGSLQGLLEMLGIPYAGCGVAASAIGMDKALMKALFREAGIRMPLYCVIRSWEYALNQMEVLRLIEDRLAYPCFVKPANGGSSVGVTRAASREDLPDAFKAAFAYDDKAVVEAAVIGGREVECSVLGNEHPQASVVGEIVPDREFYDYDSKYSAASSTRLDIPADLPLDTAEEVRELALRMYRVMGCEGYARVDFFVTADGVLANEINTIPGFTSISMYPKLWEASGLDYSDLLSHILELAFERHARRSAR